MALHLNKFESPLSKDNLCQIWLELALGFWRRFLNFVNVFLPFRNYLPLKKRRVPSYKQTWIPITQRCFVSNLVEIDPVVLEKNMKMSQVTTDDQKSSNELSTQVINIKKHSLYIKSIWIQNWCWRIKFQYMLDILNIGPWGDVCEERMTTLHTRLGHLIRLKSRNDVTLLSVCNQKMQL